MVQLYLGAQSYCRIDLLQLIELGHIKRSCLPLHVLVNAGNHEETFIGCTADNGRKEELKKPLQSACLIGMMPSDATLST